MKGRTKVKTQKWQLRAQLEAEARVLGGKKLANQERFMRAATQIGRTAEPEEQWLVFLMQSPSHTRALTDVTVPILNPSG